MKSKLLSLVLISFISGACGDRSQEDYERSRVSEELEAFQKIEGVYEGDLKSILRGESLGFFRLSLESKTSIVSQSSYALRQQLALGGQIQIESEDFLSASFSEGFYNPQSGEVDIQFQMKRVDDSEVLMRIKGLVAGDLFSGRIGAESFSERASQFQLRRKSKDVRDFPALSNQVSTDLKRAYQVWTAQGERGLVELRIFEEEESVEEKFVSLFVPIRLTDVLVDFYATVQVPFLKARFDERTGILKGSYTSNTNSGAGVISIECRTGPSLLKSALIKCRYINLTNSLIVDLDFQN